jgi:hypothetical protein
MMEPAIQIIIDNAEYHPEFRYYIKMMKKAEQHLKSQPDICIEICKSLIEGVSKTIILHYEPEIELKKLNSMDMSPLTKKACQFLRQDINVIEDEFVRRVSSTVEFLGSLRNERGDISHGKQVPKPASSNDKLSTVIFQVTSGLLIYMLDGFFDAKTQARLATAVVQPTQDEEEGGAPDLPVVEYDANPDFNSSLDQQYPYEGKLSYSFGLFSLYYEDYVIGLEEYQDSLESEDA